MVADNSLRVTAAAVTVTTAVTTRMTVVAAAKAAQLVTTKQLRMMLQSSTNSSLTRQDRISSRHTSSSLSNQQPVKKPQTYHLCLPCPAADLSHIRPAVAAAPLRAHDLAPLSSSSAPALQLLAVAAAATCNCSSGRLLLGRSSPSQVLLCNNLQVSGRAALVVMTLLSTVRRLQHHLAATG